MPPKVDALRFSDHIAASGSNVIGKASAVGLEGVVSKKKSSAYVSGRGTGWLKSKCIGRDEFVIDGYRRSNKKGRPFAFLMLGESEDGKLRYRGRVGTGFGEAGMVELDAAMAKWMRATPAFETLPAYARRSAVWMLPILVAQIAYTQDTPDGLLRHPSFLGLREEKSAEEVNTHFQTGARAAAAKVRTGGHNLLGMRLSHPERIVFEGEGATKRDIADCITDIAPRLPPHIRNRPVNLVRCPSGAAGKCFFQKHITDSTLDAISQTKVKESDGSIPSNLLLNTSESLVAASQIGALELHIWGARTDKLEKPDRFVIDLDPDKELDFSAVKAAANEVRAVLQSAGLESFALLTGGKGIHVVAPPGAPPGLGRHKGGCTRSRPAYGRNEPGPLCRRHVEEKAKGQDLHRLAS